MARARRNRRHRRARLHHPRRTLPGAVPGTLAPPADARPTRIEVLAYGPEAIREARVETPEQARAQVGQHPVVWIRVVGLGDVELLRRVGRAFGIHDLALEDVVHVHQRPKLEEFDHHDFIVVRVPAAAGSPETRQVSLFLGDGFLLSFEEEEVAAFRPVRERIERDRGRLRARGADYLAYALLDAAIDAFFPVLEQQGERVEELEDWLTAAPTGERVGEIHEVRRELLGLRRVLWPAREMVGSLTRGQSPRISDETALHLRDCYDHTVQLLDVLETYREVATGLLDLYLSAVSYRLNEIMKVLTIIATIFIPLGFIAGVYGMNFDPSVSPFNMPELRWRFGYPFALGLMLAVAGAFVIWFRRLGWLGAGPKPAASGRAGSEAPERSGPDRTAGLGDG